MIDWWGEVVAWAWLRHHNLLSWYVRPLFLLPLAWFAYRRSWPGILLTLLALATSTAWFPAPDAPAAEVVAMLRAEQDYLLGAWTAAKVATAVLVPLVFVAVGAALWHRSLGWSLVVANAAILFTIAWTYAGDRDGDGAGAGAHLPAALGGLVALNGAFGIAAHLRQRRRVPAEVPRATSTRVSQNASGS